MESRKWSPVPAGGGHLNELSGQRRHFVLVSRHKAASMNLNRNGFLWASVGGYVRPITFHLSLIYDVDF